MKKNRLSFKVLVMILLSFVLLITVSYSWFYAQVNLGGNTIETDALEYEVYGYDSTGNKISTVISEKSTESTDILLFSSGSFKPGNSSTAYISVTLKSNATMDLEYNLFFEARGYSSSEINFTELGGYWYQVTDITSKVTTDLKTYISGNETESGDKINMNKMNASSTLGSIKTADITKTKYYRLDFGVNSDASTSQYTKNRIELFANIEIDQYNNTNNTLGTAPQEYKVSDVATLNSAIETATSLDTLYFTNNVEYNGDLILKKCLNLKLGGKTLTVTGNVVYNFSIASTLKIDLSGNGKLVVLSSNDVDGNLMFDTPNAQIEILGTTKNSELFVENDIIISCANEDNKFGCNFSGIKAVKPDGGNATIILKSNSSVTVSDVTEIDTITTYPNAMNVKVINYGSVNSIDFSNMKSSSQTATPQIYIHNYDEISNIKLPTWSTKFTLGTSGTNTGNTKIANSFGATVTTLSGSTNFKQSDILAVSQTVFVESVDGTNTNLRILFKNKTDGTVTTIQGLLDDYFKSLGLTPSSNYKKIVRLEIDAVEGKCFSSTDLSFIKGTNLSGLKTLDLLDANFTNNALPTDFYNRAYITELLLPKNLTRIEKNAFGSNVKIKSLNIPKSVNSLATNSLLNIRYAIFESEFAPKLDLKGCDANGNPLGSKFNFVPENAIDSYEFAFNNPVPVETWSTYFIPVYPYATLADDGIHFVNPLADGTYEIVLGDIEANKSLITDNNNNYVIGEGITLNGSPITISQIGKAAYWKCRDGNINVTFADSVHTLKFRALDTAKFKSIDFCNIQNFEDMCGRSITITGEMKFSNCLEVEGYATFAYSTPNTVDTGSLITLGESMFSNCKATKISCPNVITIGTTAIYRCTELAELYTPNAEVVSTNGIAENNKLIEVNLPSIRSVGWTGLNSNPSMVSLYLGPNLTTFGDTSIRENCGLLKYVFIETEAYIKLNFLISSSFKIDNIFVTSSAYDSFYNNISSYNKENLYEFGNQKSGTYNYRVNYTQNTYYDYNIGEYIVNVENDGVTIVSCNITPTSIPATLIVDGVELPVVGIGRNAFKGFTSLTSIDLPYLKTTGASAFEGCTSLTTASVPNLTHWSANLFKGCTKLTKIVGGCNFTSDSTSISGTSALNNITLDYEVKNSSNLPATTIFSGMKSSITIYVRANSLSIYKADSVFKTLTLVTIEPGTKDANGNTIYLSDVVINNTTYKQVSYIDSVGKALIIPEGAQFAKEGVYDGITAASITLPSTYIYVYDNEFSNVVGLTAFSVNASNTKFSNDDNGVLYSKDKKELVCYPNSKSLSTYNLNTSTVAIRNSAFENVKNLTKIEFNANIKYIGEDAFKGSTVTTFDFSLTTSAAPILMGYNVFGENITKIIVPSSLLAKYQNNFRLYQNYIE